MQQILVKRSYLKFKIKREAMQAERAGALGLGAALRTDPFKPQDQQAGVAGG
jgi:hypothetical protein